MTLLNSVIHEALRATQGQSSDDDIHDCALALETILRPDTRQWVEQFLDTPSEIAGGRTAREIIQEGRADIVAAGLWEYVAAQAQVKVALS